MSNLEDLSKRKEELLAQQRIVDNQIIEAKIQKAKEDKIIFSSLEEFVKAEYGDGKIEKRKRTYFFGDRNNYILLQEKEGKNIETPLSIYECSRCGIVKGNPEGKYHCSSSDEFATQSGSEGYEYFCRICDSYAYSILLRIS